MTMFIGDELKTNWGGIHWRQPFRFRDSVWLVENSRYIYVRWL